MNKLPHLELTQEKSSLKNNDFIIFRHQNKGKILKSDFKNKISKKHTMKIRKLNKKKSHKKSKKSFFGMF